MYTAHRESHSSLCTLLTVFTLHIPIFTVLSAASFILKKELKKAGWRDKGGRERAKSVKSWIGR